MKFPQNPKDGEPIKRDWLELLAFVKANSVRSVVGGMVKRSPNGTTIVVDRAKPAAAGANTTPFHLSTSVNEDGDLYWKVSSTNSTIQDGTNGALVDLSTASLNWLPTTAIKFDVPTEITESKYISLKATVDSSLNVYEYSFVAETAEPDEVEFDTSSPFLQIAVRLLIGRVVIDGPPDRITEITRNACTRQRIIRLFLNGKAAKGFATI